jgi:hypothetical protein
MAMNAQKNKSRLSSRRRFLITAGSAAAVGLAGCSGDDSTENLGDSGNSSDEPSADTEEDADTDDTQPEPDNESPSNPVRVPAEASEQLLLAAVNQGAETLSFGEQDVTVEYVSYSRAVGMGGE